MTFSEQVLLPSYLVQEDCNWSEKHRKKLEPAGHQTTNKAQSSQVDQYRGNKLVLHIVPDWLEVACGITDLDSTVVSFARSAEGKALELVLQSHFKCPRLGETFRDVPP